MIAEKLHLTCAIKFDLQNHATWVADGALSVSAQEDPVAPLFLYRKDKVSGLQTWIALSQNGLLHGFGFASVLQDIGLPQTEIVAALLFFNIGVEVGQILFVGALALAWFAVQRHLQFRRPQGKSLHAGVSTGKYAGLPRSIAVPAAYVIGTLASFWMISRLTPAIV